MKLLVIKTHTLNGSAIFMANNVCKPTREGIFYLNHSYFYSHTLTMWRVQGVFSVNDSVVKVCRRGWLVFYCFMSNTSRFEVKLWQVLLNSTKLKPSHLSLT